MKNLFFSYFIIAQIVCYADKVDTGRQQYYGKISHISNQNVILQEACSETSRTFFWSHGISIIFDTTCDHPGWDMSQSPITADDGCQKRKLFKFLIKGSRQISYADSLSTENHLLIIHYVNNQDTQQVSFQEIKDFIEWIKYVDMCIEDIPDIPARL